MTFVPRQYEQIRDDQIAYVRALTNLTDFEIGSVVRTIIEASSLEDDEQYFQMVQLLDAFSINTAEGADLDERLADFNIIRLQPAASAGQIIIQNLLLTQSTTLFDTVTGGFSLQLVDSSKFSTIPGYTVRIGEGTTAVEDVTVTVNTILTNTLTIFPALLNNHAAGSRVSFVSGAADTTVAPSVQVQVPSLGGAAPIKFVTVEAGTLVNGNFESTPINAKAVVPGALGNVGANQIVEFTSSPPFTGAGVRNARSFAGGRDVETDSQARDRARQQIQSLSKGTVLALKQAALGVADPVTGQRVVTSNVLEDFLLDEVILYVDDGTGFTPDNVPLARTELAANPVPNPGAGTITCTDASAFPQTGSLLISTEDLSQIELLKFTAVNYGTNVITLASVTTRVHNSGDEVVLVDVLEDAAQPGTTFLQAQNFPIVRSSNRLWVNTGGGFVPQIPGTDYFLNRGTGEVELSIPLVSGAQVVMTYTYYAGLIKTVQLVINGSVSDPVNFPGVAAAGVIVLVETPIIHRVTVRLAITAQPGFVESNLIAPVREAVESYISSLGIGDDVIKAEIVQRAMEVAGMFNVVVVTPVADVVILQGELPVPFDTNGASLVTVS